jgi:hypothetical protein
MRIDEFRVDIHGIQKMFNRVQEGKGEGIRGIAERHSPTYK